MYTPEQVEQWKEEYSDIFSVTIMDQVFVYRLITRSEYGLILDMDLSPGEHEEVICQVATLYPTDFNFKVVAGYADSLGVLIMEGSGLMKGQAEELLEAYREIIETDSDSQADCIIHEAFPEFSIEEIPHWTIPKTMYYLSRAEWILQSLRGVPLRMDSETAPQDQQMPPEMVQQLHRQRMSPQQRAESSPLANPSAVANPPAARENGDTSRKELSQAEVERIMSEATGQRIDLGTDSSKEELYPELGWFKSESNLKGED